MTQAQQTGLRGEEIALNYLRREGYLICAQNWRRGRYELDIVAQKMGVLHFVEVKTRRSGSLLKPEQTITQNKIYALHRAATAYLAQNPTQMDFQFDLIAIDLFANGYFDIRFIPNIAESHW